MRSAEARTPQLAESGRPGCPAPTCSARRFALPAGGRWPLWGPGAEPRVYEVLEGLVRVVTIGVEGQELGLGWLGAGEVLTSAAPLGEGGPAAYLEALRPARCAAYGLAALAADPALAARLAVPLAERAAHLEATAAALVLEHPRPRLLHILRQLALRHGSREGQGYRVRIRQEDLGVLAGLCRETVNTVLQELAADGLARPGRANVWLRDWEGGEAPGADAPGA